MTEKIKKVLTFNGLFIAIGVLGSLASILTLFNSNYDFTVNVKWLIFLIYIFICLLFILVKLIYDLNQELKAKDLNPKFTIIKYLQSTDEFLIEKTTLLAYNALVSLYYLKDDFEVEIGKAYVSNISDNYIQLKILDTLPNLSKDIVDAIKKIRNNDAKELKSVSIKTFVTKN